MLIQIQPQKNLLSTCLLIVFCGVLIYTTFLSEFFQSPHQNDPEISRYQKLFANQQLDSLKAITLKNNLGSFQLEQTQEDNSNPWYLTAPRRIPANKEQIDNVLSILKNIKIRKVFPKDKINIQNFLLDQPLLELTIMDEAGMKSKLSLGLVNPIDNSTYAMLSTHQAIYQINTPNYSFGNLDYSHFVDSRIFTFDPLKVKSLKIYKNKKRPGQLRLHFSRKKNQWVGKTGHLLEHEKVQKTIKEIAQIRSAFILDKSDKEMEERLTKFMDRPLLIIEVKDQEDQIYQYILSNYISSLPKLKLEKWQNFAITASNRRYPYILKREILKKFPKSEKSFRALPFKKLFY